jgi:Prokaryotic homologs of the JAB domain
MPEREVLFLLDGEDEVLWSDSGTASALPDSRERWQAIWMRREALQQIAHSHPHGPCAFSAVDRTTMAAIDAALGRALRYLVVAPSGVVAWRGGVESAVDPEPAWAVRLRSESGFEPERKRRQE